MVLTWSDVGRFRGARNVCWGHWVVDGNDGNIRLHLAPGFAPTVRLDSSCRPPSGLAVQLLTQLHVVGSLVTHRQSVLHAIQPSQDEVFAITLLSSLLVTTATAAAATDPGLLNSY